MGYWRAGFTVFGVDIQPMAGRYPFEFYEGDALEYIEKYGHTYDFIHASPPCQGFSTITPQRAKENYPNLIGPTREALERTGRPYVIENVMPTVKTGELRGDVILCGEMFDLRVVRHRAFELGGWQAPQPQHIPHRGTTKGAQRPGRSRKGKSWHYFAVYGSGGGKGTVTQWQKAMDIEWMTDRHDLAEAIPPAYTRYLGNHAMEALFAAL